MSASASTDNAATLHASTADDPVRRQSILPTFAPIRDGNARQLSLRASSKSSSQRSGRSPSLSQQSSRNSAALPDTNTNVNEVPVQQNGTIRSTKRSSGGFLLGSSPQSSRLSRSILHRKDAKGKRPSLDSQRAASTRDTGGSSRNSPMPASVQSSNGSPDIKIASGRFEDPFGHSESRTSNIGYDYQTRQNVTSYGLDTDPSKIVDMALKLNEGRKRQASGKRLASGAPARARVISNGSVLSQSGPGQYTTTNRRSSIQHSLATTPNSELRNTSSPLATSVEPQDETESASRHQSDDDDDDDDDGEGARISRATSNRVQKAKEYFELAYEHRRLLSHLPPIRTPDADAEDTQQGSRVYNPLQYSRNRKLRFREKCYVLGEQTGWHDVQQVRAWVDTVITSHAETRYDPLECVRLPPLSLKEDGAEQNDHANVAHGSPNAAVPGKPRRPKSDWQIHPGDLIADAFWCEQGLNKLKIFDHNNDPIFPPGTKFRFSGWRNRTPVDIPGYLQQSPSSPEESLPNLSPPAIAAAPGLPTFESAHKRQPWARKKPIFSRRIKQDSDTQKRFANLFDSSDEFSKSDHTDEEVTKRGRKRVAKRLAKFQMLDDGPVGSGANERNDSSTDRTDRARRSIEADMSGNESLKRSSVEHGHLLKYLHRNSISKSSTNDDSDHKKPSKRHALLANLKLHQYSDRPRSSLDYDSTAPNSPMVEGLPSIAINLSPPASRSTSPKKNGIFHKLSSSSDPQVETTDFATLEARNGHRDSSSTTGIAHSNSQDDSRDASPHTRGPSPHTKNAESEHAGVAPGPLISDHAGILLSKTSTRSTHSKDPQSRRIRGMFKGGRIAELVGNEVSRVGDYIWKRDPPRIRGVEGGSISGYETESDEPDDTDTVYLNAHGQQQHQQQQQRPKLVSHASNASQKSMRTGRPATIEKKDDSQTNPQYHIQGLPSFTSPFQRDREAQEKKRADQSPGGTRIPLDSDDDHIGRLAAEHRSASKSPRLDRIAPPKLNIESASSGGSRRKSYGFGSALDLTKTRSASQLYNQAINGSSGNLSLARPFPRPSLSDIQKAAANQEAKGPASFNLETLRVRSLFLMTAIKAANIGAYCDMVPEPTQSDFLIESLSITNSMPQEPLSIRRRDEHAVAARCMIEHLSKQSAMFNHKLDRFSRETAQALHREIQILEDKVANTLTPRVQDANDSAGRLAQSLTTTSTLAVKGINDAVVEAARLRRHGGLRFSRRFAYKLIEGGIVGLLWLIWFVATIVRLILGSVRLVGRSIGWLLWLD